MRQRQAEGLHEAFARLERIAEADPKVECKNCPTQLREKSCYRNFETNELQNKLGIGLFTSEPLFMQKAACYSGMNLENQFESDPQQQLY